MGCIRLSTANLSISVTYACPPAQACADVHERAAAAQAAVVVHALQHLVHARGCDGAVDALNALATT